jgi:hypothetical protein
VPRPKLAAPSGRPQRPRTQRPGFQVGAVTVAELAQTRWHGPSPVALPARPGWGRSFGGPCHGEFSLPAGVYPAVGHSFCFRAGQLEVIGTGRQIAIILAAHFQTFELCQAAWANLT